MAEPALATLSGIRTVEEMIDAFGDEERCRRLLEVLVWPKGRVCPACGYRHSIGLAGRDMGDFRARPFQLAEAGQITTIGDTRKRFKLEGYDERVVDGGRSLISQLRVRIKAARQRTGP
jgi:hypothetical protein